MNSYSAIHDLLSFIDNSPTPWHAVKSMEDRLKSHQFTKLSEAAPWQLQRSGRYYVVRDDASIIVFVLGMKPLSETGIRLVGAHTDSPGLRLKPHPAQHTDGLLRLSVEIYGSPILATFSDRDLSLAGRVCYKTGNNRIAGRLIKFDRPLLRLPNLAIHMNRSVNEEGLKLHKQNELSPILSAWSGQQLPADYFMKLLEQEAGVGSDNIVTWELAVYDTHKGEIWGGGNEFISTARLDNLASCHAALEALLDEEVLNGENTLACAFFDHEEVGSESKHGAAGSFLSDVLQRIVAAEGMDKQAFFQIMAKSFLISADMAHAYHPNFPGSYDQNHKVFINKGTAIKTNANQRYSSESLSEAYFINWCNEAGAPYQRYSHRCDLPCGSTIGPIVAANLGIRSIDIGSPMWAMHSIRESAGVDDHLHLIKVLKTYFRSNQAFCS